MKNSTKIWKFGVFIRNEKKGTNFKTGGAWWNIYSFRVPHDVHLGPLMPLSKFFARKSWEAPNVLQSLNVHQRTEKIVNALNVISNDYFTKNWGIRECSR